MAITIDFCGEVHHLGPDASLTIGREGDICIEDNPFLHRRFLVISAQGDLCVLSNVGDRLSATVSDENGQMEAFLAPGATVPLVFEHAMVAFTAGATSYELLVTNDATPFRPPPSQRTDIGETTMAPTRLTPDQHRMIVALAEPRLRGNRLGSTELPASKLVADRLGWTSKKFDRKLDNVCDKLARLGVRGLHGSSGELASSRRARLVEYALATRMVTKEDLALLEED